MKKIDICKNPNVIKLLWRVHSYRELFAPHCRKKTPRRAQGKSEYS
jgi:hypothetical protein